jgi:hypothetical protein
MVSAFHAPSAVITLAGRNLGTARGEDRLDLGDRRRVLEHCVVARAIVAEADDMVATLDQAGDHGAAVEIDRIRSARLEAADFGKAVAAYPRNRDNTVPIVHRADLAVVKYQVVVGGGRLCARRPVLRRHRAS